jgi:phosphoribosylglycinamide formyltransferase-1
LIKLAFLASNNGTSLRAIVDAIEVGALDAEARVVVTNRKSSPALVFARDHGIPARVIPTAANPVAADERLARALTLAGAEWVILSGYLRKLGPRTLGAFAGRILNIHPALLPRHGGTGMYGRRVHEAVIAAGDVVTGASVHLVDDEYDHGQVLTHIETPVTAQDTAESIERRVMAAEPELFVQTLQAIAAGTLWPLKS